MFARSTSSLFGTAPPTARSYLIAPPETHRSTSDSNQRYYGEAPGRPAGGSGAGWEEPEARGSAVWGAKLGSDGPPRRGRRVKGQSRGTAWRVILQASPVTTPAERAMNLRPQPPALSPVCSAMGRRRLAAPPGARKLSLPSVRRVSGECPASLP